MGNDIIKTEFCPLVSIIVPVYNVENYLDDCISSILNQTYKNIEIIVVDDGSTDSSGKKCDDYSLKDKRIKVFHKKNSGLGLTRNYGIERSSGKYILFVDSDDYVSVDMVSSMINQVNKYSVDSVISGWYKVSENGKIKYEEKYSNELFTGDNVKNLLLPRMIGSAPDSKDSIFTTACAKLYSADIIKNSNLRFVSEREIQSEDLAFQLDYFVVSKKAAVIDNCVYYYRTNQNSLTTKYKANRFDEIKKVYTYVLDKISINDFPSSINLRLSKMMFVQLKVCFNQEIPMINNKTKKECLMSIKKYMTDELIQEIVCNYPINKLKFSQKLYLLIIKHKLSLIMYILMNILSYRKKRRG